MGYRSEVYIKVEKQLEEELVKVLEEVKLDNCFQKEIEDDNYVGYHASYLKWYSGYPDVDRVTNWILEQEDGTAGLLQIGEDCAIFEVGDIYDVELYPVVNVEW